MPLDESVAILGVLDKMRPWSTRVSDGRCTAVTSAAQASGIDPLRGYA